MKLSNVFKQGVVFSTLFLLSLTSCTNIDKHEYLDDNMLSELNNDPVEYELNLIKADDIECQKDYYVINENSNKTFKSIITGNTLPFNSWKITSVTGYGTLYYTLENSNLYFADAYGNTFMPFDNYIFHDFNIGDVQFDEELFLVAKDSEEYINEFPDNNKKIEEKLIGIKCGCFDYKAHNLSSSNYIVKYDLDYEYNFKNVTNRRINFHNPVYSMEELIRINDKKYIVRSNNKYYILRYDKYDDSHIARSSSYSSLPKYSIDFGKGDVETLNFFVKEITDKFTNDFNVFYNGKKYKTYFECGFNTYQSNLVPITYLLNKDHSKILFLGYKCDQEGRLSHKLYVNEFSKFFGKYRFSDAIEGLDLFQKLLSVYTFRGRYCTLMNGYKIGALDENFRILINKNSGLDVSDKNHSRYYYYDSVSFNPALVNNSYYAICKEQSNSNLQVKRIDIQTLEVETVCSVNSNFLLDFAPVYLSDKNVLYFANCNLGQVVNVDNVFLNEKVFIENERENRIYLFKTIEGYKQLKITLPKKNK